MSRPANRNGPLGTLHTIAPDDSFRAVTPSDTVNIANGPARSLYIGTGGTVIAINARGQAITFSNVPDGAVLPILTTRVKATGTTASGIIAL